MDSNSPVACKRAQQGVTIRKAMYGDVLATVLPAEQIRRRKIAEVRRREFAQLLNQAPTEGPLRTQFNGHLLE
eukprot:2908481-Prymnesium_polylepis.1